MTTPPGPPGGQPPYGQPPQGQPPYGPPPPGQPPYGPPPYGTQPQGQPRYGQPPYGPPQGQPPYGPPQGPPPQEYPARGATQPSHKPPGPRRGKLLPILIAVGVVVLLLGGGGAWFALRGGPGGQSQQQVLWSVAPPKGGDPNATATLGSWLLDTTVARGQVDGVHAYDQATGKQAWDVSVPAKGSLCGMSPTAENGVGVITYSTVGRGVFGAQKTCNQVMAIDTRAGKKLWTATTVSPGGPRFIPHQARSSISGDAVVVTHDWGVTGYKASDGTVLWQLPDGILHIASGDPGETCLPVDGLADRGRAFVVLNCDGMQGETKVLDIDPKTGKILWDATIPVQQDAALPSIVSVSPAVVLDGGGRSGDAPTLLSLDDSGQLRARISAAGIDTEGWGNPALGTYRTYPMLTTGNTLIARTELEERGSSQTNRIVAFDLASGKKLWTKGPGLDHELTLVSTDGKTVTVMDNGNSERPGGMLRFSLADGSFETLSNFSDGATSQTFDVQVYQKGDELFLVSHFVHATSVITAIK